MKLDEAFAINYQRQVDVAFQACPTVVLEMSIGRLWGCLIPNQRFLAIYHHLSCYAVYS